MPILLRSRAVTICLSLLLAATLISPWFRPYLVFAVLNGLVLTNATILYTNITPSRNPVDMILGIFVLFLSQITVTQLYPGLAGYATLPVTASMQGLCLLLTLTAVKMGWLRCPAWRSCRQTGLALLRAMGEALTVSRPVMLAATGTVLVFVYVFAVSALNPPISIDSIFFHLLRPVEWLQTGQMPYKLMPNYSYPHGIGLITLWLLFPFHHDFVARLSQTPLILAGAIACYGICRTLDVKRPLALVIACVLLTTPAYLANGIALTDPDTQLAGTFLIALYFALSLARAYRPGAVKLLALALGLLLSAKYNAVYYGAPLVVFIVYVWIDGLRRSKELSVWRFIGHGFILVCTPLIVGGVTYLYDLYTTGSLHPFSTMAKGIQFIQTFSPSLFIFSPKSLLDMGLSGIVGCAAVAGFIMSVRKHGWREIVLPVFVALPVVFSIGVYYRFGYYQGPLAIRHLLGTMALGLALAGWTVSQMDNRRQRYGVGVLMVLMGVNVVLGFVRQWPLHRLHTDLIATCCAVVCALAAWRLLAHRQTHGASPGWLRAAFSSTSALLLAVWIGLWAMAGWEWAYRDLKYARWPPFFGFGSVWNAMANLTVDHGARIAFNVSPYPLFGYDLQNTLIPFSPALEQNEAPQVREEKLETWMDGLIRQNIDYVFLMAIGPTRPDALSEHERFDILTAWMSAHPETFTRRFQNDREAIFRLNRSGHIEAGTAGGQ